ncbi:hypothetical protein [Halocatena marina]|uniref:hypothetical protein n=1 Tax=Halocatena marina TaxID=2934937 RepID=UPI002010A228|nr:hypothetical protein [Halocatena marina]
MPHMRFSATSTSPELTIVDPIQRRQFPLTTAEPIDPIPTETDQFSAPTDRAVEITTEYLTLPYVVPVYVRDTDGNRLLHAEEHAYEQLPEQTYIIELLAPIKIFLRVHSTITIASWEAHMKLEFTDATRVCIGARSYHEAPAGTITTTETPEDMAAAISTFGSALKTTSCERSLPSLRGHPPAIELGDRFYVPDNITRPETGVRIEIPDREALIYAVSPLAYYLGAEVVIGELPRIVTENGVIYRFDHSLRGFQNDVERLLKQVLFFDCIIRTEGRYKIDLHERTVVESRLPFEITDLYDAPLSEQIEQYLAVPFEDIVDVVPQWPLTTHVTPDASILEQLPYLVNYLSFVRPTVPASSTNDQVGLQQEMDAFMRGETQLRSAESFALTDRYITLPSTPTLEHAWLGPRIPLQANKLIPVAFQNKLHRRQSTDEIDITVVCNDSAMLDEYTAGTALYGDRDELPFDITVHQDCSVADLHDLLRTETDFFHYIGHTIPDGFICRDGTLETASLTTVGIDTFLLNSCRSYEVGTKLIEAGSVGGIVTHSDIGNDDATGIGQVVARLLNCGFSLRSALAITQSHRRTGRQYIVVGDGSIQITQSESGTPYVCSITPSADAQTYSVQLTTYPTTEPGIGSVFTPFIDGIDQYFLTGGELPSFTVSADMLDRFLRLERVPVVLGSELVWSTDVSVPPLSHSNSDDDR